jgi:hypothetical protein
MIRTTEHGDYVYGVSLKGDENNGFQWNIALQEIVPNGVGNGWPIYEVTNRTWELVGPVFEKRAAGARWLGYEGGSDKTVEHGDQLIAEYNGLYSDEVETRSRFEPEYKPKFGAPSQGRDRRLQFSTSSDVERWLQSQRQGTESLSQAIHRLLEARMHDE